MKSSLNDHDRKTRVLFADTEDTICDTTRQRQGKRV